MPTDVMWSPGHGNVFIPGFGVNGVNERATGRIQIEFSRSPDRFSLNRYIQLAPDSPESGWYLLLDTAEAVRMVNDQDYIWPDGSDAPDIGDRPLAWRPFTTVRRAFPFRLGRKAVDNAAFDIVAAHSRMSATQAMTRRTREAVTELLDATVWGANTELTATAAGGGPWDGVAGTNNIKKTIHSMVETVMTSTGGAVSAGDMILVIGVATAHTMSESDEIIQYMVNHERAMTDAISQAGIVSNYGLPTQLYGVGVVVEDAVEVKARRFAVPIDDAAQTAANVGTFMMGPEAVLLSRPNGLTGGITGGPTFSTLTGFVYEDMVIENFDDPENRRVRGRVVDDIDIKVTAPMAGFLVEDVFA